MKKTILVILILFAAMVAKAQWYVGGSINAQFYQNLQSNWMLQRQNLALHTIFNLLS